REAPVPLAPLRSGSAGRARLANERQVRDRNHPRPARPLLRITMAIGEGVELLDITDLEPRLLSDPATETEIEGAVPRRVGRAERARLLARLARAAEAVPGSADRQDARHLLGDGNDDGVQPDDDLRLHGLIVAHLDHDKAAYSLARSISSQR